MTRIITRLYPRAWRERYGAELSDLIDETGMTPRVAIDVARDAAREWTSQARLGLAGGGSMVIGPAYRHPNLWALAALSILAPTLVFVSLSILAYQIGVAALVPVMEPINAWLNQVRFIDIVAAALPVLALVLAAAPLLRLDLRRSPGSAKAVIDLRLLAPNVIVGVLAIVVIGVLVSHAAAG
jgi:hypothetical protein